MDVEADASDPDGQARGQVEMAHRRKPHRTSGRKRASGGPTVSFRQLKNGETRAYVTTRIGNARFVTRYDNVDMKKVFKVQIVVGGIGICVLIIVLMLAKCSQDRESRMYEEQQREMMRR